MAAETPSIHASAVLCGARAVLIRGPAGSGKSQTALELIRASQAGRLPFARLVGDDRVHVAPHHGRLLVRPAANLAGLIEIRGVGVTRMPFEAVAVVGLVVDLAAADAERLPPASARETMIGGICLPRLAVARGTPASPLLFAVLGTADASGPPVQAGTG